MQVEEFSVDDDEGWASLVGACGGNALHLPAIHLAQHEPDELRLLAFRDGGAAVGCVLAILSGRKGIRRVLGGGRTLTLPTAPAAASDVPDGALRDALFGYARENSCDRLVVQPAYGQRLCGDEELARFRSGAITEFILALDGDEDSIAAAYHKTHRKNVRRAIRQGLVLTENSGLTGLALLREMQMTSAQRASERAEGFGVPAEEYFRRVHEHVYAPGHGHVILAELAGRPVATLAWIAAAGRVQTVRSGSSPEGYETRAMYFLYDELIRRSIRQKMIEINCGGVPLEAADREHPQHGLYEFKAGFGSGAFVRHGLDIPMAETSR
jgi:hypothetical protein